MSEISSWIHTASTVEILAKNSGRLLTDQERKNITIDIHTKWMQESEPGTPLYRFARARWLEEFGANGSM